MSIEKLTVVVQPVHGDLQKPLRPRRPPTAKEFLNYEPSWATHWELESEKLSFLTGEQVKAYIGGDVVKAETLAAKFQLQYRKEAAEYERQRQKWDAIVRPVVERWFSRHTRAEPKNYFYVNLTHEITLMLEVENIEPPDATLITECTVLRLL